MVGPSKTDKAIQGLETKVANKGVDIATDSLSKSAAAQAADPAMRAAQDTFRAGEITAENAAAPLSEAATNAATDATANAAVDTGADALFSGAAPYMGAVVDVAKGNYKGAVGSTVGGVVGSYFGPVGTMVGSAVGGYAGNAIGGILGFADGTTGVPAQGGKGASPAPQGGAAVQAPSSRPNYFSEVNSGYRPGAPQASRVSGQPGGGKGGNGSLGDTVTNFMNSPMAGSVGLGTPSTMKVPTGFITADQRAAQNVTQAQQLAAAATQTAQAQAGYNPANDPNSPYYVSNWNSGGNGM
jgi:hypothetical protein